MREYRCDLVYRLEVMMGELSRLVWSEMDSVIIGQPVRYYRTAYDWSLGRIKDVSFDGTGVFRFTVGLDDGATVSTDIEWIEFVEDKIGSGA